MAQFDTTINILVKAQEAFRTVAKLEDKINKLNNPTTRKQVTAVVREDKQKVKNAEKLLSTEVRLSAASQRRATVEKALNRAGIANNKDAQARVKALQKAGDAGEGILSIQNAVNAGLEKELQIRREINRTKIGKEKGQRDLNKFNARINRLKNSGLTASDLEEVKGARTKFSSAVDRGELDEAKRLNAQLQQKLFLLERINQVQKPGTLSGGARSPVGGSATTPGSPKYIQAQAAATEKAAKALDKAAAAEQRRNQSLGGARSPVRGSADTPGSPKYIEAQAKAVEKLAKVGGPSSPLAARSVLGSDEALRKKAAYYDRIAKSVKPLSSSMRAQSVLGSDEALRKKAEYYERIAKSAKNAGARSPIRGSKNIPGSPKYIEAAARAEKKRAAQVERRARAEERAAKAEKSAAASKRKGKFQDSAAASKRKGKFQDVALGVGFPLLFGGGPGSVIGGLLGGLVGGMGGSVLVGALGQQLDKLGAAALETGKAFNKVTSNLDAIIPRLGRGASEGFSGRARFLTEQGLGSQVGTEALNVFEDVYGAGTLKRIQELGQTNKEWDQTMQELGIRLQDFISGPLAALLAAIQKVTGAGVPTPDEENRANRQARIDGFQSEIDRLTPLQGKAGSVDGNFKLKQDLAAAQTGLALEKTVRGDINEGLKTSTNLQDLSLALAKQTAEVEEASIDLVRNKLTARRDSLAADKGALAVQQEQNKLQTLQNQLKAEENRLGGDTYLIAKLTKEVKASEAELQRQQLARANAILEAERQITREVSSNNQAAGQAYAGSLTLIQQLKDITQSQTTSYGQQQELLDTQFKLNKAILAERQKMELLGKTEGEVIEAINNKYVQLNQQEEKRLALQKEMAKQAEIMRRDREQEIIDSRELTRLEAERSAALKIRSMDMGRKNELSREGLGFFGDSAIFADEALAKSAAQIEAYNEEIGKLQARITTLSAEKVDPEKILPLQKSLDDTVALRDSFQKLQPAIDAAAIKQAQYNDAFNAISPIIQGITTSFSEIVKGTKSVEEAFADMFAGIADAFLDMVAQMLAQEAALAIVRAFTGPNYKGVPGGRGPEFFGPAFAGGGYTGDAPRTGGVDGKGGFPAILHPQETVVDHYDDARSAMSTSATNSAAFAASTEAMLAASSNYAYNTTNNSYSSSSNSSSSTTNGTGTSNNSSTTIQLETQVINQVEYATVEEVNKSLQATAKKTEANVYRSMRNKPATRNRVGV